MILQILNLIANTILCASMTLFYIYLYADPKGESVMNKWSATQSLSLKLGLIGIMAGSLFNVLTFANSAWTEVLLNTGLAATFFWAYKFHKTMFDKQSKK